MILEGLGYHIINKLYPGCVLCLRKHGHIPGRGHRNPQKKETRGLFFVVKLSLALRELLWALRPCSSKPASRRRLVDAPNAICARE